MTYKYKGKCGNEFGQLQGYIHSEYCQKDCTKDLDPSEAQPKHCKGELKT